MSGVNCSVHARECVCMCVLARLGGAGQRPEANVPNACWREVNNY